MIKLHIFVEGNSEEAFVNNILKKELHSFKIELNTVLIGGLSKYSIIRKDIRDHTKQYNRHFDYFSTMFDLYRLPVTFPGFREAKKIASKYDRVKFLEEKLHDDVRHPENKFIPYIQLHEFEAVLFSNPSLFKVKYPHDLKKIEQLENILQHFHNPELINDDHPPSKRIKKIFTAYEKLNDGLLIAQQIGLAQIRAKCPHFDEWIGKLEGLGEGGEENL